MHLTCASLKVQSPRVVAMSVLSSLSRAHSLSAEQGLRALVEGAEAPWSALTGQAPLTLANTPQLRVFVSPKGALPSLHGAGEARLQSV